MKTLQEMAKEKGKELLIESFLFSIPKEELKERVTIFDKPKIIESVDGKEYKARGIIRSVDVTKYTENMNKRIYTKELWEKVCKSKIAEGTLSLMGHPEDDGNPKDICGVWHNMAVMEETSKADWFLVGDHGSHLLEVLEAGGKIGISTVGFGEFLEDGKTVNPESYELERLGDAVINPSQGLYATLENCKTSFVSESLQEDLKNNPEKIEKFKSVIESSFNSKDTNNKEGKNNNSDNNLEDITMSDKIHEANLKNQVRVAIKEAKANPNAKEAIEDLQEVSLTVPTEMTDIQEKITRTVEQLQLKLEQEIKESQENLKSKDEELTELKAKYETLEKTLTEVKERFEKAKGLLEKCNISEETPEEDVEDLKESVEVMKEDIMALVEDTKLRDADIQKLIEDREVMQNDIDKLIEIKESLTSKNEKLNKNIKNAEKHIQECEDILENEFDYEFEDDDDHFNEALPGVHHTKKKKEQDDDDDNDDDDEKEEKKKKKEQRSRIIERRQRITENNKVQKTVKEFFDKEVEQNTALKEVEDDILGSKSLIEAVQKVERFKSSNDGIMKLDLQEDNPAWLGKRL